MLRASAALRVPMTGTDWTTLPKTYLRMIVIGFAPIARAASTYVVSRVDTVVLRTTR